jgi:Flp pilus assembly protein TadB
MRRLKLYLAVLGFTLAAAGVALDLRPLVWAAMSVLAGALAVRLWERRDRQPPANGPSD